MSREKKVKRNQPKVQMLELAGKKFKAAIINRFKNLKENIVINECKERT